MEDLRWILLLVGALVIAAVYFSSRFEREDWVREREQFDARKQSSKKASKRAQQENPVRQQQTTRETLSSVEHSASAHSSSAQQIRKEPQMTSERDEVVNAKNNDSPIASAMPDDEKAIVFDSSVLDTALNPASSSVPSSASSVIENSKIESKVEPELNTNPATTFGAQNLSSIPVEEKVVAELDEVDEKETFKTASASEMPTEVILTEETVAAYLDASAGTKNHKETTQAKDEIDV